MKKIIAALMFMSVTANATWQGKFDLTPLVSPIVIRELHDGQWLYGVTKENLWHLDYQGSDPLSLWNGQRFHVGVFQAWNAENGNASFGMVSGIDVPLPVSQLIGQAVGATGLTSTAKWLSLLGSALSLDFIGGYRPIHTNSVNGDWIYGIGARLSIKFGATDLQKGL